MIFLFFSLSILLSNSFVCRAPELYKYRENRDFIISKEKIRFLNQLKNYSDKIQNINYLDAIFIKNFYKKIGINSIEITDFLKFLKKGGYFNKKFIKNRDFILKNNLSKAIQKNTWNYMGSFIEFYRAICSIDGDDKIVYDEIANETDCILRDDIKNSWNIDYFFEIIKKGDELIYDADFGFPYLTPFVAKMILVEFMDYYLKNSNSSDLRKDFWSGVIHKQNIGEFRCGHFCESYSSPFENDLDYYTTHMGYVLVHSVDSGHLTEKISNELNNFELINKNSFLDEKKEKNKTETEKKTENKIENDIKSSNSKDINSNSDNLFLNFVKIVMDKYILISEIDTVGVECSYYLQRVLENMGYKIKGRLKSSTMEQKLSKDFKSSRKREFFSEELLIAGDMIQQKGHTWVFAGYGNLNKKYIDFIKTDLNKNSNLEISKNNKNVIDNVNESKVNIDYNQNKVNKNRVNLDNLITKVNKNRVNPNVIYILTYEAVGNRARSVGLFYRMMPYEKKDWSYTSCDINEIWKNDDEGFKPAPLDEFKYIYRLIK